MRNCSQEEGLETRHHIPFRKVLSSKGVEWLDRPITFEELKNRVLAGDLEKAPGLDGFTFAFFHKVWDIITNDIWKVINYFDKCDLLGCKINHTFITIVLKKMNGVERATSSPSLVVMPSTKF